MSNVNLYGLTFDIDWAPDWAIEECIEACLKMGAKGTFFITHDSPFIRELIRAKHFEFGIHPNFLNKMNNMDLMRQEIDTLLSIVPNACAFRTHGLFQSAPMFDMILKYYPQLSIDSSILLYKTNNIELTKLHLPSGVLTRAPYVWEDDVAAYDPEWSWSNSSCHLGAGLKIFNFHPIHFALNMVSMQEYQNLKSLNKKLPDISKAEAEPFTNQNQTGTKDFFKILCENIKPNKMLTDLVKEAS